LNVLRSAIGALMLTAMMMPASAAEKAKETTKQTVAQTAQQKAEIIARGEYLAQAGDCVACHTAPGGKLFAGGHAMPTPFGTLFTSNVTPDKDTGIGKWTADQFYNMMHTGRSPDGGLLYPAMPFASYTKVTRADSDAIYAFMMSVPPVKQPNRPHDLKFPYNNRSLILGWRTLYFTEGEYKPDGTKSDEWNRGAYLVQGLGHCSMCHTAINALGGSSESKAFEGGLIPMQNWYAPSLTSNKEGGLGDWSIDEISDLLRTGVSARGAVYGPMADVTYNSLQYMTEQDTRAMAVYLKSLGDHATPDRSPPSTTAPESSLLLTLGQSVYADKCASCHGKLGKGMPPHYPPLAGNQSIQMASAVNPIRMVLNGGYPPGTAGNPMPYGMPPFAQSLSDDEVAAVVTYIRVAWGNHGAAVSASEANALRSVPLQ
jgi:mono/diheme cytochrome c family protein